VRARPSITGGTGASALDELRQFRFSSKAQVSPASARSIAATASALGFEGSLRLTLPRQQKARRRGSPWVGARGTFRPQLRIVHLVDVQDLWLAGVDAHLGQERHQLRAKRFEGFA
jgi:hypothetical protein